MDARFPKVRWSMLLTGCLAAAVLTACSSSGNGRAIGGPGPGTSRSAGAGVGSGGGSSAKLAAGKDKARFVNVAVDPSNGNGTAIDIYLGSEQPTTDGQVGTAIGTVEPKPAKWVSGLAFGAASDYIAVPDAADAYVTAAGGTTILNVQDAGREIFDADGLDEGSPLKSEPLSDTYIVHSETSLAPSQSSASSTVLTIQQMKEPADFEEDNGQDLPIAGKAVLISTLVGVSNVDTSADPGANERQFGVVNSGSCLPEEHGDALGGHYSYLATYSPANIVEYVTDPGQLAIGIWSTGDEAACTGVPPATFPASLAGGERYYAIGYGPASAPKVLLLTIPAPLSGKTATPTPQPTN